MQGKKQTALAIQRYHILCAAIQEKYVVRHIAPIEGRLSVGGYPNPISRVTIEFSPYIQFKLHPIKDVELPDARDGMSCDYADVATYQMAINGDWRMREGGILFAVGEYGDFFNTMTHYHSGPKGTLMEDWNTLFEKLQNSEYRKNLIPCMFLGQKDGCLDRNCPFLHEHEAVLAYRAQLLEDRRERIMLTKHQPTWRQNINRYHSILDNMAGGDEALRTEIADSNVVDRDLGKYRAYCANPRCMKPWKKDGKVKPLKACKRCKFTFYCSPECQKADWPRHKKDPCAPIEEIIENDDLWNPIGHRKGTHAVRSMKDLRNQIRWHPDA
jgi:hypothetical protein